MQQIRISSAEQVAARTGRRFDCQWMEACQMNRWFLKARLAEALATHGPDSHWIETRPLAPAERARSA
jgi:hypothetical protein